MKVVMKKVKSYQCDYCNHIWVDPISIKSMIIDWFKFRKCPMCKRIHIESNPTSSPGPR